MSREIWRPGYGDCFWLDELVSFAALESDFPSHPRAFIAAVVETESIPPWPPHDTLPRFPSFDPSLQTTESAALMPEGAAALLLSFDGPVWAPGSALSVVSVGGPVYLKPELSVLVVSFPA